MVLDLLEKNIEIVSLIISIFALTISILQIIYNQIKKIENFNICIDNAQAFSVPGSSSLICSLMITNNSLSVLNINRIYFIKNGQEYLCYLKKQWCGEHYYPKFYETDIPRTERVFSSDLPISISPQGATSKLIRFKLPFNDLVLKSGDIIDLKIVTSKNTKKIKLSILDDKRDLSYM